MTKNLSDILSTLAFALLFLLCLAFVGIRLLGLGTYIVTGGSMEPNIGKGALVLVQPVMPTDVKLGDVITFQQYDQTTTHRVIAITRDARGLVFHTKGDANVVTDPEDKTFAGAVGVVRATLPLVGYVAAGAQAYWRLVVTLAAAVIFFGCAGTLVFRKEIVLEPARLVRMRRVLVTVDPDEAWRTHVRWLERGQLRRVGLA
jgi:signal peptidase